MSFLHCEGWWEQSGYGRQPMEQLRIEFDGGDIRNILDRQVLERASQKHKLNTRSSQLVQESDGVDIL